MDFLFYILPSLSLHRTPSQHKYENIKGDVHEHCGQGCTYCGKKDEKQRNVSMQITRRRVQTGELGRQVSYPSQWLWESMGLGSLSCHVSFQLWLPLWKAGCLGHCGVCKTVNWTLGDQFWLGWYALHILLYSGNVRLHQHNTYLHRLRLEVQDTSFTTFFHFEPWNILLHQLQNDKNKRPFRYHSKKVGQIQDVRPLSVLFLEEGDGWINRGRKEKMAIMREEENMANIIKQSSQQ